MVNSFRWWSSNWRCYMAAQLYLLSLYCVDINCYLYDGTRLDNVVSQYLPFKNDRTLTGYKGVNIDEMMAPFADHNCFIHITNFQNRNMYQSFPVTILQITMTYTFLSYRSGPNKHIFGWTTAGVQGPNNGAPVTSPRITDKTSKFVYESTNFDDADKFIMKINRSLLAINSRPWTCEVEFGISPPNCILDGNYKVQSTKEYVVDYQLMYPDFWYYHIGCKPLEPRHYDDDDADVDVDEKFGFDEGKSANTFSSVARFMVLYVDGFAIKSIDDIHAWINNVLMGTVGGKCTGIDVFATVHLFGPKVQIQVYKLATEKPMWNVIDPATYVFNVTSWKQHNVLELTELGLSNPSSRHYWSIVDNMLETYRKIRDFKTLYEKCQDYVALAQLFKSAEGLANMSTETLVFLNILKAMMGNHTIYKPVYVSSCEIGGLKRNQQIPNYNLVIRMILETSVGNKTASYYPLTIEDQSTTMRFVSCDKPNIESLVVHELYRIFDKTTWITIIMVISIMSACVLGRDELCFNKWISNHFVMATVFLEQGINMERIRGRKFALLVFVLMSIIISNGYKSTNIYNMVSLRKIIRYTRFHEIIAGGFKIYSRFAGSNSQGDANFEEPKILNTERENDLAVVTEYKKVTLVSEMSIYLHDILKGLDLSCLDRDIVTYYEGIVNSTHIQNKTAILTEAIKRNKRKLGYLSYSGPRITKTIMEIEKVTLKKSLKECNKIALTIPEHLCFEYAKEIVRERSDVQVDVGKEGLGKYILGISFWGPVPPHLQKRIRAIAETGIIEWVPTLFRPTETFNKMKLVIRTRGMDGNIVLIFLVFLAGNAIAALVLVLELSLNLKVALLWFMKWIVLHFQKYIDSQ